jgi:polyisoprenoid-binding protein YceI
MKTKILYLFPAFAIIVMSFVRADNASWTLDKSHAKLGFTVTHLMVSDVDGSFGNFDAKITSSGNDFSNASAEMTADVNSINTGNDMRDNDLKGPKYFDAAKFPTLTFKSTSFKKTGENTYKVSGNLTIHGVTKPVDFDVLCRMGVHPMNKKTIAGFKITGKINRKDFGIGDSAPEAMVSNEIELVANAEFSKD